MVNGRLFDADQMNEIGNYNKPRTVLLGVETRMLAVFRSMKMPNIAPVQLRPALAMLRWRKLSSTKLFWLDDAFWSLKTVDRESPSPRGEGRGEVAQRNPANRLIRNGHSLFVEGFVIIFMKSAASLHLKINTYEEDYVFACLLWMATGYAQNETPVDSKIGSVNGFLEQGRDRTAKPMCFRAKPPLVLGGLSPQLDPQSIQGGRAGAVHHCGHWATGWTIWMNSTNPSGWLCCKIP